MLAYNDSPEGQTSWACGWQRISRLSSTREDTAMKKLLKSQHSIVSRIPIGIAALATTAMASSCGLLGLPQATRDFVNEGDYGTIDSDVTGEPDQSFDENRNSPVLLIKHGWDIPSAQFVHDHVAEMEQMPFDGVIVTFDYASHVQSQTPVSYEQFRSALAPVRNTTFTTMSHNFVIVYTTPAGSFFDDYSAPVDNFRRLARAAREAGLEGIVFDNEAYFGNVWDWPDACPNHSLEECNDQARARGREVMQAMIDEWPDIVMMVLTGPWRSEPRTANAFARRIADNNVADHNELLGPFFIGMVEAANNTDALVVDGGQIYTLRTAEQFEIAYHWQHDGMAEQSSFIPDDLRSAYPGLISASFGIYDRPWLRQPMNAAIWGETIELALRRADNYVWAYTEAYDWWGTGWPEDPVPQSWVDATVQARANAGSRVPQ
jgi:hypothetical protein